MTKRIVLISYITTDEGWLYLAAVKDLATMEIVGWSMSERLKSVLCETPQIGTAFIHRSENPRNPPVSKSEHR